MFVIADVAQSSIPCQHMDDEQQCDATVSKNGGATHMLKAGFQTRQKPKVFKELPEENQTGEGREALMFKGKLGDRTIVSEYGLRTIFHARRFPFLSLSCLTLDNIRKMGPSCFII